MGIELLDEVLVDVGESDKVSRFRKERADEPAPDVTCAKMNGLGLVCLWLLHVERKGVKNVDDAIGRR